MRCRFIAFVDHEIGYRLLEKMISIPSTSDFELLAVVTTLENGQMWWPDVSNLCQKKGIPLHRYDNAFYALLEYADVDWYFLLSWKHIIPPDLLNHPKHGAINLHYSLLPEYRGVYPVNWAIMEGKKKTGVTYHLVNEKIDDGQILCQREAPIFLSDTARSLQLRLDDLAYELFDEMIEQAKQEKIPLDVFVMQDKVQASYKSRSEFMDSNELSLERNYNALDFINLLRGKTFMDSKNLYITDPASGERIYINICLTVDQPS